MIVPLVYQSFQRSTIRNPYSIMAWAAPPGIKKPGGKPGYAAKAANETG
jgi:hypothetical protein